MASCLVPDFPAVMVALEHLKELDQLMTEDGTPFSQEASLHVTHITAAITELEEHRRAAHEHLEVETIENSKLRHQISHARESMRQEVLADVAAARASNAEEMGRLRKDLITVSQLQGAAGKRQEALLSQNEVLYPEREQVKAEHDKIVAALNDQITIKYNLQRRLAQTQEHIEEVKSCTAVAERDKITLQQNMELQREAFTVKQDDLSKEVEQIERQIKRQKQENKRNERELDRANDKKQKKHDRLVELMIHMAKLESNLCRLTASLCQCEEQLEGETKKHQALKKQKEMLKKELHELKKHFSGVVQHLKEEIITAEVKIEAGRASRLLCKDTLAQIYEVFTHQLNQESEVRVEHSQVSQQLERSKLKLEERIASIVKHSMEIKEMDKQITELLQADTINKRIFEKNQEEMCSHMDIEKRHISHLEEEKMWLTSLLEKMKRKQEQHVVKMNSDISSTRRRYQDLQQEEAALQQQHPKSRDADLLMSHVIQCELEYRQKEAEHHQEIEQCTVETEGITRSNGEKQREMEETEDRLNEVESLWRGEQARHGRLETLTSELKRERDSLELSVQELQEQTISLLQPKEQMKAQLEEMRKSYMDMLYKQASELRAAEMSIYDNKVKVEQVSMENSRLHLCIRQMTESVHGVREDKDRYWQEIRQLKQDTQTLFERLQEAWGKDLSVTQDCQSSDSMVLASMRTMMNHLKTRRQQCANVSMLLHQQMLDFSKRLGDKVTAEQHRVSDNNL